MTLRVLFVIVGILLSAEDTHLKKLLLVRITKTWALSAWKYLELSISNSNIPTLTDKLSLPCEINIGYSPAGRSVLGKTVPKVLDTARGHRPWMVLKTEGTVFPITDQPRLLNDTFFSTTQRKPCERPEHFRAVIMARFVTNWTISCKLIVMKTEIIQVEKRGFTERFLLS